MLRGTIKYEEFDGVSSKIHTFNAYGIDSSSSLNLRIESSNYDSILFMADSSRNEQGDELWERGFNIGISKATVETASHIDGETGKRVKSDVNFNFFLRLASVIRYAKAHCYTRYIEGFTGLQLASGEYSPEAITKYIVPFEYAEDGTMAVVELKLGNIYSIQINAGGIEVDLKDDPFSVNDLMPVFKNGVQKGFCFLEEYLGFRVKPQELELSNSTFSLYQTLEEVMEAHPDKEFDWLLGKNYKIVTDETLDSVIDYIYNFDGEVYYDTETTGLNINFKSRTGQADQCVGIILSVIDGESFYFPMQMKSIKNLCGGDHFYFMEHYARKILEEKRIVVHNLSFDWKVSYIYDINPNIVDDTLALFKLTIGQAHFDMSMQLKYLTKLFLRRDSLELDDLVKDNSWGESDVRFWDLPAELVRLYACADTDNTRGLKKYAEQTNLLTSYNASKIYEIEIAFSYAVAYQEFFGHLVDITQVEKLRAEIQEKMDRYYTEMHDMIGHDFNPNSSPQLLKIMYGELGIPEQISRKTGRPTTDKDTLKHLSELTDIEGNVKYPFCYSLIKYREYEGVRKIIDKFPELATSDGYLFSGVQQFGTTTGRVSIKEPNYQSYNNPVKKNIIPRPGYYMFDTDYSSVEYRVLGNMSGNQMIKDSFYDPDFDYHAYQAARMYGVPYANVTSKLRKAAKGINFGLPYGMGDPSLGVRIFGEETPENTRKAGALRRSYFKGQEDIEDFFNNARDGGVANGFTETYFGRRRYYNRSKFSVSAIRRQAGNQVIQGTAADIYKLAVGRVFKRICKEGWLGKVLLTGFIHDELLGEVSYEIDPMLWLKTLREEFEVKITNPDGSNWCPLYMGFGWGRNWYEAKSVEIPIKLQWEFVDKYGETGYPSWNGNVAEFCDNVPKLLRDFEIRDCASQLLSEEAQGNEIKPALNKAIYGVLSEDREHYSEVLSDESLRVEYNIVGTIKDEDGHVVDTVPKPSDTQQAIDLFCMLHNVDRSKINVLNIKDVEVSGGGMSGDVDYGEDDLDEETDLAVKKQQAIDTRIKTLGLYTDVENKTITCLLAPSVIMELVKARTQPKGTSPSAYQLRFVDFNKHLVYETEREISTQEVTAIQNIYIQYLNQVRN